MADLSLRLLADASNAQGAFKDFGSAITAAGSIVKEFAAESIKAYADAERVQRQLKSAAGEYTQALSEQAEVMKQKYAVDDDQIRQLEVLALRYGAAPGQIQKATEAVLNFSAATGKDASSAMQELVRGVESGTGSLGRMGVHFKATGDFVKDFGDATDALGKKFAGAAEADANSLAGRMRKAQLALDDVKKAFGELFDAVEQRFHVFETLAKAMDRVTAGVQEGGWGGAFHAVGLKTRAEEEAAAREGGQTAPGIHLRLPGATDAGLPMTSAGDHAVGNAGAKAHEQLLQRQKTFFQQMEKEGKDDADIFGQVVDMSLNEEAAAKDKFYKQMQKERQDDDDIEKAAFNEKLESESAAKEKFFKQMQKEAKDDSDIEVQTMQLTTARMQQEEQAFSSAGMRLGQAFSSALEAAMQDGGDHTEDIMLDLLSSILSIAGAAVGGYYEGPAGAQAGGMLGGLAGSGIKAAVKSQDKKNKRHDGGWIERFHGGGWPLANDEQAAILQTGERVLSRREVATMGGPSAVDSAARGGGGGLQVHVTAMDTRSTREFFENQGGRGFYNALRTGRGSLVPLLGAR